MTKARVTFGSSVVLAMFLGAVGCASPTEESAEETASTEAPLVAFNPCHPDWQLPTSARRILTVDDPAFLAFEDRLEAGGARWVGNFSLPKPYRAIVRVDTYLDGTKKAPRSGLWYLAAIPVGAYGARSAVREFASVAPVNSRELGYCAGTTFIPNKGSGPGNIPITHVIAEYDPRCVCRESATSSVSVWVDYSTYGSTPYY